MIEKPAVKQAENTYAVTHRLSAAAAKINFRPNVLHPKAQTAASGQQKNKKVETGEAVRCSISSEQYEPIHPN